jgi:hypothetical protein
LLDYIWAGLPIITTRGDVVADLVERKGLGRAVTSQSVDEVRKAILTLLDASPAHLEAYREAAHNAAANLTWDRVVSPLVAFCQSPHLAADKEARRTSLQPKTSKTWTYLLSQAKQAFRSGGLRELYRSTMEYQRWTRSRRQ